MQPLIARLRVAVMGLLLGAGAYSWHTGQLDVALGDAPWRNHPLGRVPDADRADALSRERWENRTRRRYPGTKYGAKGLQCGARVVRGKSSRVAFVAETLQRAAATLPLATSLEVGPCNNPIRLPTSLVRVQHTVDWAGAAKVCSPAPTIEDDAQHLRRVADASYDLVLSAHAIEHMPNVFLALSHWVRVVKPGGFVVVFLPDACASTGTMMDRLRLAVPAQHYIDEWRQPAPAVHRQEIALSQLRFLRVAADRRHPEPPWWTLERMHELALPQMVRDWSSWPTSRKMLGHVHVWSTGSLRDMVRLAEPALGVRGIVHGSYGGGGGKHAEVGRLEELRFALQRNRTS